jgi:predicted nucleic acid-binding protein
MGSGRSTCSIAKTASDVRVYFDSSALLKRVVAEPKSAALQAALRGYVDSQTALVSSSVARIEVSRALRRASAIDPRLHPDALTDVALSGVLERPLDAEVVALARRVSPLVLRSPDAIHVATAMLVDADVLVTYDDVLVAVGPEHGFETAAPM